MVEQDPSDYGATRQRTDVVEVIMESSVLRVTVESVRRSSPSDAADGEEAPSPNRRMRLMALRTHMEMMLAFALLRRKYLDRLLVCAYFALLVGTTPFAIWLFIQDVTFATVYLTFSRPIHVTIQLVNVILLYLYISTAFNLRALFTSAGVNPLVGNVLVAACSGALLALECVDRVAVYLNSAHYDGHGSFVPLPTEIPAGGSTPDSPLFVIMSLISFFAVLMAFVNGMHLLYYGIEYRRAVDGALEHMRDGDTFETE